MTSSNQLPWRLQSTPLWPDHWQVHEPTDPHGPGRRFRGTDLATRRTVPQAGSGPTCPQASSSNRAPSSIFGDEIHPHRLLCQPFAEAGGTDDEEEGDGDESGQHRAATGASPWPSWLKSPE